MPFFSYLTDSYTNGEERLYQLRDAAIYLCLCFSKSEKFIFIFSHLMFIQIPLPILVSAILSAPPILQKCQTFHEVKIIV